MRSTVHANAHQKRSLTPGDLKPLGVPVAEVDRLPERSAAIEFRNVTKSYRDASGEEIVCLSDITFTVAPHQLVCVVGPSGCGKSTLLGLISGVLRPTSGNVYIAGVEVTDIMTKVGYVFQNDLLLPWKHVIDNVEFALKLRGIARGERHTLAMEWLSKINLTQYSSYYPHQLSGGMRKRVAVAQSLIYEPAVLLLDEPFSSLDAFGRDAIEDDLLELFHKTRSTCMFVTHDIAEAVALGDEVIVMGSSGQLKSRIPVSLPRPRRVGDVRGTVAARDAYDKIWQELRPEVRP